MKKFLITTMYGVWLGFSLAIVGFNILTWQFWFVFIPTSILVGIRDYELYEK